MNHQESGGEDSDFASSFVVRRNLSVPAGEEELASSSSLAGEGGGGGIGNHLSKNNDRNNHLGTIHDHRSCNNSYQSNNNRSFASGSYNPNSQIINNNNNTNANDNHSYVSQQNSYLSNNQNSYVSHQNSYLSRSQNNSYVSHPSHSSGATPHPNSGGSGTNNMTLSESEDDVLHRLEGTGRDGNASHSRNHPHHARKSSSSRPPPSSATSGRPPTSSSSRRNPPPTSASGSGGGSGDPRRSRQSQRSGHHNRRTPDDRDLEPGLEDDDDDEEEDSLMEQDQYEQDNIRNRHSSRAGPANRTSSRYGGRNSGSRGRDRGDNGRNPNDRSRSSKHSHQSDHRSNASYRSGPIPFFSNAHALGQSAIANFLSCVGAVGTSSVGYLRNSSLLEGINLKTVVLCLLGMVLVMKVTSPPPTGVMPEGSSAMMGTKTVIHHHHHVPAFDGGRGAFAVGENGDGGGEDAANDDDGVKHYREQLQLSFEQQIQQQQQQEQYQQQEQMQQQMQQQQMQQQQEQEQQTQQQQEQQQQFQQEQQQQMEVPPPPPPPPETTTTQAPPKDVSQFDVPLVPPPGGPVPLPAPAPAPLMEFQQPQDQLQQQQPPPPPLQQQQQQSEQPIPPPQQANPTLDLSLSELSHFKDSWDPYEKSDIPVFWHIPKAGGSSIKDSLGGCHRFIQATEFGITDGHDQDTEVAIVYPKIPGVGPEMDRSPFVNIDSTTVAGIQRAKDMGFADAGLADVVVSPFVYEMNDLFTDTAKGRFFSVFRHPIDRAISMFYYIQVADWEPSYKPELKDWSLEQYAQSEIVENNWMTRQLSNQLGGELTEDNLAKAMEVVRRKFMVGLMTEIEPTMARFEKFFRWTFRVNPPNQEACRERLMSGGSNSNKANKKPLPQPGEPAWDLLAHQNNFDLRLYEYIEQLFVEQEQFVTGLPDNFRNVDATCCKCDPPTYPPEGFTCPVAVKNGRRLLRS